MTENEKKALACFPYPRTLESAYELGTFRNRANFLGYVKRLLEQGYLEKMTKKERSEDNLIEFTTIYRRSKRNEKNN